MAWKPWKAEPGEIYLTDGEKTKESGFVYIEPNIKGSFGNNKDWGFDRWQAVVDALPDIRFVQGPGRKLRGIEQRDTGSFRGACGLLHGADFFVGTDGALHHAAAALGKRAVVVWGGLIGPETLGYDSHINLRGKGVKDCGSITPCLHCRQAMDQVKVGMVIEAVSSLAETSMDRQPGSEDRLAV
jgi:ADP-heptose:LPS heptosyltransferase